MKTYWKKRAKINRRATIELMRLTQNEDLIERWDNFSNQYKPADKMAVEFNRVITCFIDLLNLPRGGELNAARAEAVIELKHTLPLDHCEKCKQNPNRPESFEEHLVFMDERSLAGVAVLLGMSTDGVVLNIKISLIMAQHVESLKLLDNPKALH